MRLIYSSMIVGALVAGGAASGVQPARATEEYPWCIVYHAMWGGGGMNCGFHTFEQCKATMSGTGGLCVTSPYYRPPQPAAPARKKAPPQR